jgi:hypothetical protein
VHRDLKPENLQLTADGRIKILDFGLARLAEQLRPSTDEAGTSATESGVTLGTAGYMSPEQVRGKTVDARSDLFSMGAVLYEMLTGRRAFDGATSADRLSAILTADPPELSTAVGLMPPLLSPIVRRCLEKNADDRFQNARDLAFALEDLALGRGAAPGIPDARRGRPIWFGLGAVALLALGALASRQSGSRPDPLPTFSQLTFRRGMIADARFTADGNTVVYGGLFDGQPAETYSLHLTRKESLKLDLPAARLFGVSAAGELAIVVGLPYRRTLSGLGTLARVPLAGGIPRELATEVYAADWSPDGRELAALRDVDGAMQLEYPLGRVLQRPIGVSNAGFAIRVSPDGNRVALSDLNRGVRVVDRGGHLRVLTEAGALGVAWDPSGRALWTCLRRNDMQSTGLWILSLDGTQREAARFPGSVMVHDVARDGRVLVHAAGHERGGIRAAAPADGHEREMCPLAWCQDPMLTDNGSKIALRDYTEHPNWVYWRSTRGGPPVRLGEGGPWAVSPDERWVLVGRYGPEGSFAFELVPTAAGTPRSLNIDGISQERRAWLSEANDVYVVAEGSDKKRRTFLIGHGDTRPVAVTPAGVSGVGGPVRNRLLASTDDGALAWYPLAGGEPLPVGARRLPGSDVAGLSGDGRFLFEGENGVPGRIHRLDLQTGRRTLWREVGPEDPTGFVLALNLSVSRNGGAYAYAYVHLLQDLYLVGNVR